MNNEITKPQIPDDEWPEWATHAAYGASGDLLWLEGNVEISDLFNCWEADNKGYKKSKNLGKNLPTWRESLVENPKFIRQREITDAKEAVIQAAMEWFNKRESFFRKWLLHWGLG